MVIEIDSASGLQVMILGTVLPTQALAACVDDYDMYHLDWDGPCALPLGDVAAAISGPETVESAPITLRCAS